MKTIICVLILFSTIPVFSQTVSYAYDAAGNRTTRTVTTVVKSSQTIESIQAVTALPDVITEKDISVYPNPTHGHFTVDISNLSHENMQGDAFLYDASGRLLEKKNIHSHSLHKKLGFDLTHKPAGVYILNLRIGENKFTWKIMKK